MHLQTAATAVLAMGLRTYARARFQVFKRALMLLASIKAKPATT